VTHGLIVAVAVAIVACSRPPAPDPAPKVDSPPVATAAPATDSPPRAPIPLPNWGSLRIAGRGQGPVFQVELARSEIERQQGLMYRKALADDRGMVFFMPGDAEWSFWMRNTYVPLDLIFLRADWSVACVVEGARPLDETPRACGAPSRFVLELVAGSVQRHGLRPGTALALDAAESTP
jgi:uncharacterized membrane protein (UPF0127 family)